MRVSFALVLFMHDCFLFCQIKISHQHLFLESRIRSAPTRVVMGVKSGYQKRVHTPFSNRCGVSGLECAKYSGIHLQRPVFFNQVSHSIIHISSTSFSQQSSSFTTIYFYFLWTPFFYMFENCYYPSPPPPPFFLLSWFYLTLVKNLPIHTYWCLFQADSYYSKPRNRLTPSYSIETGGLPSLSSYILVNCLTHLNTT